MKLVAEIPETLLLWDIDKTLLSTAGVSREVYSLAFETLTGRSSRVVADTAGRTEFEIMKDLFHKNFICADHVGTPTEIEEVLVKTLAQKRIDLSRRGAALPGARRALCALADFPTIVQSVLTGNVRRNATTKLAAFGLDAWLDLSVGAYGSEGMARWELVEVARQRVDSKYGKTFDARSTILVGDTPKDVEAARVGGAKIIAVASGASSVETLLRAGADCAIESLDDTEGFILMLRDLRHR